MVQWLQKLAGSLRKEAFVRRSGPTLRTEETIEIQDLTLLFRQFQEGVSDACPVCGSTLTPPANEPVRPQLGK